MTSVAPFLKDMGLTQKNYEIELLEALMNGENFAEFNQRRIDENFLRNHSCTNWNYDINGYSQKAQDYMDAVNRLRENKIKNSEIMRLVTEERRYPHVQINIKQHKI